MRSQSIRVFGLPFKALALLACVLIGLVGGVVLNRLCPHSSAGALLFGVSLFLGVPIAVPALQGESAGEEKPIRSNRKGSTASPEAEPVCEENREPALPAQSVEVAQEVQDCWSEVCSGRASEG